MYTKSTNAEEAAAMRKRAIEVSEKLEGTCNSLHDHATEVEQNNQDFCNELDMHVEECGQCNWWCEPCEMRSDGICTDCGGDEDLDD